MVRNNPCNLVLALDWVVKGLRNPVGSRQQCTKACMSLQSLHGLWVVVENGTLRFFSSVGLF